MKKYFLFACVAAALVSCSSDEFLGENPELTQKVENDGAIMFKSFTGKASRGNHVGADAAALLNEHFTVEGSKTVSSTAVEVFDDYVVKWAENTAGQTESNTSDWEYVGTTAVAPSSVKGAKQSIKYWDYSASQYDFAAYSTGTATAITTGDPAAGEVLVSAINYANLSTAAYTLKGATADLAKCYISDLVTAYNPAVSGQPEFQKEVQFQFRNLAAKTRVAFYETVPGYSVKNVKFYTSDAADLGTATATDATLFTVGSTAADKFYTNGTYTVSFPHIGKTVLEGTDQAAKDDYNKAHVTFAAATDGTSTTQSWGALQYGAKEANEKTDGDIWLGRTSTTATFAGAAADHFTTVLPNETGTVLELRVDYTLESTDGSGETINVYGAKALVPAHYAAWKSNYAYTYIFKISDATNGWTSKTSTDPAGLFPITFDAVVADAVDGAEQTTITTVATPSITTYQKGHLYTDGPEYSAAKGDIYVQVMADGAAKDDLGTEGKLYTLSTSATEAEVLAALNMQAYSVASGYNITGRNGLSLKNATSEAATTIPGVDGNNITPATGTAVKFTPAAGTYAYVYTITAGTADEVIVTAVSITAGTDFGALKTANAKDIYYTDAECTVEATGTAAADGIYYQKYVKNNGEYAVKVIKVVS